MQRCMADELRAREEGCKVNSRIDDVWVIPCNPNHYNIVAAFDHLDVIEWSQSTNTTVGDRCTTVQLMKYNKYVDFRLHIQRREGEFVYDKSNKSIHTIAN